MVIKSFSFAVLGDMHYVYPEAHTQTFSGHPQGVTDMADTERNLLMTQSVVPGLLKELAQQKPDFLIQTGDLVHGNCDSQQGASREMELAHQRMEALGVPIYYAMGTHDGVPGRPQSDQLHTHVYPAIGRALGRTVEEGYYSFKQGNSLFIVLDYTTYRHKDRQYEFLVEQLRQGQSYNHVFLFAHPPIVPVGRPFFTDKAFAEDICVLLEQFPVDLYLCGHTHNQIASLHRFGNTWIPQLKGAAVGFPDKPPVMLQAVRPILSTGSDFQYLWGFLEDSAPGWWQIVVEGDIIDARWYVFGQGLQGHLLCGRKHTLQVAKRPSAILEPVCILPPKLSVQSARLRLAGSRCPSNSLGLSLNGQLLQEHPVLEYFDCRQFVPVPLEMLNLTGENHLILTMPEESVCFGGAVLELLCADGVYRSCVSDYYANTNLWDEWLWPHPIRAVAGQQIFLQLPWSSKGDA